MHFVQLLNSLDELLYELMSWLVFFPVTLWRMVRHPLETMSFAEQQLLLAPELQYRGTVSPPIMLILAVVLVQGIGLAVDDGTNEIVSNRHGLAGLVNDDTTLFLLRMFLFGNFAIVLSTLKVVRSGVGLDRDTLKPAFFAQCYAIAPFALLLSIGVSVVSHGHLGFQITGLIAIATAFLFYGIVQVRWLTRELGQSHGRSFVDASLGMIISIGVTGLLGALFV